MKHLFVIVLLLAGCKAVDPRGPIAPPTIVKQELKKVEEDVQGTVVKTQTVYRTVEKVVDRYPEDELVKQLQVEADDAQKQTQALEKSFAALKLKVDKAQAELITATEKLKQWQEWYNKEYEKRVAAEASANRKKKWLLGSGILNIALLGAAFLFLKRPF